MSSGLSGAPASHGWRSQTTHGQWITSSWQRGLQGILSILLAATPFPSGVTRELPNRLRFQLLTWACRSPGLTILDSAVPRLPTQRCPKQSPRYEVTYLKDAPTWKASARSRISRPLEEQRSGGAPNCVISCCLLRSPTSDGAR